MTVKDEVHQMVERLTDDELRSVKALLRDMLRPGRESGDALRTLLASCPDDDEPYTEEEQRQDAARLARYRRGVTKPIPHDEILHRGRGQAG